MTHRPLNLPELGLLIFLVREHAEAERLLLRLHTAEVSALGGAGAGSLRFGPPEPGRRLGEVLGRTQFLDEDGVPVLVALYADQLGELYELDCWKADDTPVRRIPAF